MNYDFNMLMDLCLHKLNEEQKLILFELLIEQEEQAAFEFILNCIAAIGLQELEQENIEYYTNITKEN